MSKAKQKQIQSVKGMHDILPEQQEAWSFVISKATAVLEEYGFGRIDPPVVEQADLFIRSIHEGTDIIDKELYRFKTKGGDDLALRPEFTASIARAYVEYGMHSLPQPVKLYAVGPVFRHDQPQAGRFRQFYQIDSEIIGEEGSAADAELIFIAYTLLQNFGLKNFVVRINSIGDHVCRPEYVKQLRAYYRSRLKKVCTICQDRFKINILRTLDCSNETCREVIKGAPQMLDFLDEECKRHFKMVLEFLDELGLPYFLEPYLVRGLDYYTRTVFEFWPEEETGLQLGILQGGRYDRLIDEIGGHTTPAVGWAAGIERIILFLESAGVKIASSRPKTKVFLAQLGDLGKKRGLLLFEELRKAHVPLQASFGKDSIKSQLRIAAKIGVRWVLIMGQKEALGHEVILRDMNTSAQEIIPLEKVVEEVKRRLKEK